MSSTLTTINTPATGRCALTDAKGNSFQLLVSEENKMRFQHLVTTLGLKQLFCPNPFSSLLPRISSIHPRRPLHLCPSCWSRLGARKTNYVTPLFLKAEEHLGRTAVIDHNGSFTYDTILHHSSLLSKEITRLTSEKEGSDGVRVAFLCENDVSYVVSQWATWMAGATGVPLCKSHPVSELEYFVEDSQSSLLICTEGYADKSTPIANKLQIPVKILQPHEYLGLFDPEDNHWFLADSAVTATKRGKKGRMKSRYDDLLVTNQYKKQAAIIVYTSGTTGKPKGVVLTHGNLHAMMTGMISSWEWRRDDVILHVLPLHHVHGIVNVLMTPLYVGASCVMLPTFDPAQVWSRLLNPVTDGVRINLFMAVPTIYAQLLENYESRIRRGRKSRFTEQYVKSVCRERIRLMVSGSAALPQPIMERWEQVTGHRLLERYGMTEIGMALTNPLHGPRVPGTVGNPFPGVEVCIVQSNVYSSNGYDILAMGNCRRTTVLKGGDGEQGELMVKGPNVFPGYWNKPDATSQAFTRDGWFKTGDTAVYENGVYSIVGRSSVDVIKSGGYKISALYIERHLLAHPLITDCAVIGLPDITWGQKVAAILVLKPQGELTLVELKAWAKDRLPAYQIPTVIKCLDTMPRNAMGKVNKKELMATVFPEYMKKPL